MNTDLERIRKPRCVLLYAIAPPDLTAAQANQAFNNLAGDRNLPLVIYHDHFIGTAGGIAIFFVETAEQREVLLNQRHLQGWKVELHPLIFSYSPAAFDEQTEFTLRAYRGQDWEKLRIEQRPSYGDPRWEAETAQEQEDRG